MATFSASAVPWSAPCCTPACYVQGWYPEAVQGGYTVGREVWVHGGYKGGYTGGYTDGYTGGHLACLCT